MVPLFENETWVWICPRLIPEIGLRVMSTCPLSLSKLHGPQGLTDEDRSYIGSRFADVKAALFENPYQKVWGATGNGPFPVYIATIGQAFQGFLPGGDPDLLRAASARTIDSRADLRWGDDRKGFRRIIHPNGICLFGRWEIHENNVYSGYFKKGSRGLVIARFSPNTKTLRGEPKSLSLVGKIYPTTDEGHPDPLFPANFFTQEDFGNERTRYLNDAEMRNAPDVTSFRRRLEVLILLRQLAVFRSVDKVHDVRQLHEIAELGKPVSEPTRAPEFMQLKMAPGQPRIEGGDELDFRDEIYAHIFDRGDPQPKRMLRFDILVSDRGRSKGFSAFKRVIIEDWQKIGEISFDNCVASYNGDHVIHFHHPNWRNDRNDPATTVRVDGKRVDP